jgi:DNA-binding NtrC family response regulator
MRQMISVAVFDREDSVTVTHVRDALKEYQSVIIPCASDEAVLGVIGHQRVDVAILNLSKPFDGAFRLLAEIQAKSAQTEVIFVAHFDDELLRAWMEVIQRGAYEFLPKPLDREELKHHVVQAAEKYHPVERRKRPPAESVKDLNATSTNWASAAGA